MFKSILVPICDRPHTHTAKKQAEIIKNYGMPIPTHAKMYFTPEFIEKATKIQSLMTELNLTRIDTLSSYRKDITHSRAELYHNDHLIPITKHEDFDELWDSFDEQSFSMVADSLYRGSFHARFLYVNGWSEFSFRTKTFSLSDLSC